MIACAAIDIIGWTMLGLVLGAVLCLFLFQALDR
jgi:hypothetical protein